MITIRIKQSYIVIHKESTSYTQVIHREGRVIPGEDVSEREHIALLNSYYTTTPQTTPQPLTSHSQASDLTGLPAD
jgi:hypothetical protein